MRTQPRSPTHPHLRYTPLAASVALALVPHAAQAACTNLSAICVNDPGDSNPLAFPYGGQFTYGGARVDLRGALTNCTTGAVIQFDLGNATFNPGSGPFVIKPSIDLPAVCAGATVDGEGLSTSANQRVTIDGSAGSLTSGLSGSGATVNGLAVTNVSGGQGLSSSLTATNNVVSNSLTGIQVTGTVDSNRVFGNNVGIEAGFSNQQITNNVVYGNTTGIEGSSVSPSIVNNQVGTGYPSATGNSTGIFLEFARASVTGNTIVNNDVGIDLIDDNGTFVGSNMIGTDGTVLRGNQVGIVLDFAYGTSISSNTMAAPATGTAIALDNSGNVSIGGNSINVSSSGTSLIGGGEGIVDLCGFEIGITGNLITTSGRNAIDFGGTRSNGNTSLDGNAIGLQDDHSTPLGSILNGVSLHAATCGGIGADTKLGTLQDATGIRLFSNSIVGASQNGVILDGADGTLIAAENFIGGSQLYGVEILAGIDNAIIENFIYGNGVGLGTGAKNIDLNFHGAGPSLPNDPGDTDSSPAVPNDGQNYPGNISVHYNPNFNQTTIEWVLDSNPGTYRIDFYENIPPTTVPGGTPLSFANTFQTLSSGPAAGSLSVSGEHSSISLTATLLDAQSNPSETSEYSPVNNDTLVPNVQVSPLTLDFGQVPVTSTNIQSITVKSTGTDAYVIGAYGDTTCYGGTICYGGAFTCTSTCSTGHSYTPGATCSFTVDFNPQFLGTFTQTIGICDNAPNSPRTITLTGTAVIPPPITFTPPSFDFGSISVGRLSPPETFTVLNPTGSPVGMGAASTSGDYVIGTNTCGTNLGPGESCTVDVSFTPLGVGERDGALSIVTSSGAPKLALSRGARFMPSAAVVSAGTVTATAALTGTGVVAGALTLPGLVDFGAYALGATPITRTVTLHNTGNAPVHLSNVSVDGPFTMTNPCPATLAPDQSCTITLTFSSPTLGNFTGTLTVVSDAPGGSGAIALTASAIGTASPVLDVSPLVIGFGSRMIGTTEGTQRVTIKNVGAADAVLQPFAFDGVDFTVASSTCGLTLTPGSTCFAQVSFMPLGFGLRKEHLTVLSNATNNPVVVELGGTGCRPFSVTGGASSCSP